MVKLDDAGLLLAEDVPADDRAADADQVLDDQASGELRRGDVDPLAGRREREVLVVNPVDVARVALGPLDRFAQIRADLDAPGGVNAKSDLRRTELDQVIEHIGLSFFGFEPE